jgi:hypothetical protein
VSCVPGPVVRVVAVRSVAVSNAHTRPHTCPGFVCLLPAAHACAAGGTRMLALLTCCEGMRGDHTRGYTLQRCRSGIAGVGVGVGRAVSKLPRTKFKRRRCLQVQKASAHLSVGGVHACPESSALGAVVALVNLCCEAHLLIAGMHAATTFVCLPLLRLFRLT